jgi:protein-tyrosine phosphatase
VRRRRRPFLAPPASGGTDSADSADSADTDGADTDGADGADGAVRAATRNGLPVPPPALGDPPYRITFVCTGNICRSPMAEVITRSLAETTELGGGTRLCDQLRVRSAGTGPWHEGEPMHLFALDALARAGYPRYSHSARQIRAAELADLDLVVALDRRHLETLRGLGADPGRLRLLRSFDPAAGAAADVPDPYYGDDWVFDDCRDMIAVACDGLVRSLATNWDSLWGTAST